MFIFQPLIHVALSALVSIGYGYGCTKTESCDQPEVNEERDSQGSSLLQRNWIPSRWEGLIDLGSVGSYGDSVANQGQVGRWEAASQLQPQQQLQLPMLQQPQLPPPPPPQQQQLQLQQQELLQQQQVPTEGPSFTQSYQAPLARSWWPPTQARFWQTQGQQSQQTPHTSAGDRQAFGGGRQPLMTQTSSSVELMPAQSQESRESQQWEQWQQTQQTQQTQLLWPQQSQQSQQSQQNLGDSRAGESENSVLSVFEYVLDQAKKDVSASEQRAQKVASELQKMQHMEEVELEQAQKHEAAALLAAEQHEAEAILEVQERELDELGRAKAHESREVQRLQSQVQAAEQAAEDEARRAAQSEAEMAIQLNAIRQKMLHNPGAPLMEKPLSPADFAWGSGEKAPP